MFYVVGLGNSGNEYQKTRHNVGRFLLEDWVEDKGLLFSDHKPANADEVMLNISDQPALVVLPNTYMNKSGDSLAYYVNKHQASVSDFIVLHDDIDLGVGEIKISRGRGDGGNNGIRSIINRLGSKDFVRVRIGIAPRHWWTGEAKRPLGGSALEKFVLQKFTSKEMSQIDSIRPQIFEAVETIVKNGPEAAMNQFN